MKVESGRADLRDGRALVANAGAMVVSRYGVAALGWLGTVLIVRRLSVEQFGRFSFVLSLLGLLSVFADLGIGRVSIRGLLDPGMDAARFAGTLVALRAVMGVVAYGVSVAFVVVAGYPGEVVHATLVAGVVVLVATPSHAVEAVFQAHLRLSAVAVANLVGQFTQLALTAAVAVGGGSVVAFAVPAVVGEVVIFLWKLAKVRHLQPLRLNIDLATWKALVVEAAPLAAGIILATFYYRVDSVMLSKLDTFTAVAVYNVAYKFVDLVHYLPTVLMVPVLAILVRSWPDDEAAFGATFRRAFMILALTGILVTVEFSVFARPLIATLYGARYSVGAGAARVVVASQCLSAFGTLAFTTLVAMDRNRLYPLATLTGLVVNVGLNLVLIPAYSYPGAAAATLVTEVLVVSVLFVPVVRMEVVPPLPVARLALALLAGAVSALVALAAWRLAPWPVAAAASVATFVVFVHVARVPGRGGWWALLGNDVVSDHR